MGPLLPRSNNTQLLWISRGYRGLACRQVDSIQGPELQPAVSSSPESTTLPNLDHPSINLCLEGQTARLTKRKNPTLSSSAVFRHDCWRDARHICHRSALFMQLASIAIAQCKVPAAGLRVRITPTKVSTAGAVSLVCWPCLCRGLPAVYCLLPPSCEVAREYTDCCSC